MKKKVLVVVAHPDDETIWMGGNLIRNKDNWDTTVICLCRASDKDRAPKFKKACEILGVKGFIFDLDDTVMEPIKISEITKLIINVAKEDYDYVFTHGENGEYGHIRHMEIHKAIQQAVKNGLIKTKKVFFFSYLKKENDFQGYCICNSSANNFIKLNSDEISLKKDLITRIYGYQKNGFEEKSSGETEGFDILEDESINSISLSSRA